MNAYTIFMAASAPATEHGEHAAEHGKAVFPPLDVSTFSSQLFWLFIVFGLLLLLLAKVFLPRLGGILEDRSNRIADDLDGAARMQREAESAELAYEQSLKDARAKAHNVAETTRASINAEIDAEMEASERDVAKQMEAAEAKIRKLRTAALANVDDIATDTAKSLVEKLFAGKITLAVAAKAVKAQN
ncbi:MAG: ATP F0F1 synthase subunit B' [Robiginitomaculum sp.]|nr:MAG: ATP F0F1 synthase subunit B' [Robiginitomaculum sp.]